MSEEEARRLRDLAAGLGDIADRIRSGGADREELERLLAEVQGASIREFGPRPPARPGEGGQGKILGYLQEHLGEWVHGSELAMISGISTWARRTRELRTEYGYEIEEEGGYYRLTGADPDEARAGEWRLANEIRRRSGSAQSRILAFLEAKEGEIVSGEMLAYVGKISSTRRRARELRDEQGWPIETHIDDPTLQSGEYRLVSSAEEDRADVRQRLYEEGVRERVFERDDYTCQKCGRNRESAERAGDRRFYLELHHQRAVAEELDALPPEELNNEENLVTYCHRDHVEETARLQRERRGQRRGS